ncbi:hypothetical protein HHX47_DHR1001714 [Lentinula edodes]|nr:hypothetical protein HHX47_DHR1001714 [Lentinula edodes]
MLKVMRLTNLNSTGNTSASSRIKPTQSNCLTCGRTSSSSSVRSIKTRKLISTSLITEPNGVALNRVLTPSKPLPLPIPPSLSRIAVPISRTSGPLKSLLMTLHPQHLRIPFRSATRKRPPANLVASSAEASVTPFSLIATLPMAQPSGHYVMGRSSSTHPARCDSAPTGTSSRPAPRNVQALPISALSAAVPTPHSDGIPVAPSPVPQVIDSFKPISLPPLAWYDFSATKTSRPLFPNTPPHFSEIYNRIITPYSASAFAIELARHNIWDRFPFLIEYLTSGFPLGDMPVLHESIIIPNHSSVHKHPDVVWDYIHEEAASNRMSGPFSQDEIESIMRGPFFCSPFIVIEHSQGPGKPAKRRVCRNLSKDGRDSSGKLIPCINSHILKEHFPTSFDSATHTANLVVSAPPGTKVCTMDITKFHRTIPLRPQDKPYMVVRDPDGKFWVDHCYAFGAASASSNSGMVSSAGREIWQALGIAPIAKVEDDLAAFITPNTLTSLDLTNRDDLFALISDLGFPWHPEKGEHQFVLTFTFIGFLWDLELRRVSLPEDKRLKYLFRLQNFLDTSHRCLTPRAKIESIHGTLCHIAFIYTDGKTHLPPFSNFMSSYRNHEVEKGKYPDKIIPEIQWWIKRLSVPHVYRQLRELGPMQDLGLFVDASTDWGIGIIIGGKWAAFHLANDWKIEGRDICWLETVAVEILIYFLESMNYRNTRLLIHSDNQGTIGAIRKSRSPNYWINMSIRRTCAIIGPLFILPELIYIESANNPADPISRGILGLQDNRLPLQFQLPDELSNILSYYVE